MDNLISRQVAIDAIKASASKYTGFMEMEMYMADDAIEAINGVPSVQPECKKGKRIDRSAYCVCDQCGHTEQQFNGVQPIPRHTPFCASCGADMREEITK